MCAVGFPIKRILFPFVPGLPTCVPTVENEKGKQSDNKIKKIMKIFWNKNYQQKPETNSGYSFLKKK